MDDVYASGEMALPPQRQPGDRGLFNQFLFGTGRRPDFGVDEGMRAREQGNDIAGMAPSRVSPSTKQALGIANMTDVRSPPTNLNPPRMPATEKTPPTNLNPPRMPTTEKTPPTRFATQPEQAPAWYETDNFYKALTNLGLGLLARNKPGYGGIQGFAQALGEAGLDTSSYLEQLTAAERAAANEARAADRADRALNIQEQANQLANTRGLAQLELDYMRLDDARKAADSAAAKAKIDQQLEIIKMAIDMYKADVQAQGPYGARPDGIGGFVGDIGRQLGTEQTPGTRLRATDTGIQPK